MVHAALLKGCVALVLQFDWTKDAGSLPRAELESAIVPALLTLARRIGKAAQLGRLPVNDSVSLVLSIIQAGRPFVAPEWPSSFFSIKICSQAAILLRPLAASLHLWSMIDA